MWRARLVVTKGRVDSLVPIADPRQKQIVRPQPTLATSAWEVRSRIQAQLDIVSVLAHTCTRVAYFTHTCHGDNAQRKTNNVMDLADCIVANISVYHWLVRTALLMRNEGLPSDFQIAYGAVTTVRPATLHYLLTARIIRLDLRNASETVNAVEVRNISKPQGIDSSNREA